MIDVIIPAYNGQKYIDLLLTSLINQTIVDKLNVIIINDGSKEDYHSFIEKYSSNITLKEITLKKNRGAALARQVGIDFSSGEYIIFLDCDDELYNNKSLEILYNSISNNPHVHVVEGQISVHGEVGFEHNSLAGKIFRRSFINKYKIKNKNLYIAEDTYFSYAALFLCDHNEYLEIDDIVYIYHLGRNNNSSLLARNNKVKIIKSIISAYEMAFKKASRYNKYENAYIMFKEIFYKLYDKMYTLKKSKKNPMTEVEYTKIFNLLRAFYHKYKRYIEYGNLDYYNNSEYIKFLKSIEN